MQYLVIGLVLFVIYYVGITLSSTYGPYSNEKLTKQDILIIVVISLATSALSTGALCLILNY